MAETEARKIEAKSFKFDRTGWVCEICFRKECEWHSTKHVCGSVLKRCQVCMIHQQRPRRNHDALLPGGA